MMSCQVQAKSLYDSYAASGLPIRRNSEILDNTQTFDKDKAQSAIASMLTNPWFKALFAASAHEQTPSLEEQKIRSESGDGEDNRRKHPMLGVPTLPKAEENEPWYDTIEIGYAWLAGYRPDLYWKNTTACFDRLTNYTYHEVETLQAQLDSDVLDSYEKTEATLLVVRNFSAHMWHCNSVIQTFSFYWNERLKEFNSFGHFLLSMLQNFLGNVISLSNIYLSIEENLILNNTYAMHYDIARVVRILTIFEPVELKDPEDFNYTGYEPTNPNPGGQNGGVIPDPDVNQQTDTGFRPRTR